eukprot:TRINITY_DN27970_c0_g1_i1.p2 TRINITY_DN27970_c0_g1~~TRINITY_DN27970_c0_g1_i1.p2  ORF type:complete len:190 (-),score=11.02 TRINITY_DN27970_c0_g1_i1:304-873(-)
MCVACYCEGSVHTASGCFLTVRRPPRSTHCISSAASDVYKRKTGGGVFSSEMACSKTLYNYIDLGLMAIKNTDLSQKLRRTIKKVRFRKNKRILGRSIEERDESIESRKDFGHWEIDTVIGVKDKDDEVLLTLVERKTRHFITKKINNKGKDAVMETIAEITQKYGDKFSYKYVYNCYSRGHFSQETSD